MTNVLVVVDMQEYLCRPQLPLGRFTPTFAGVADTDDVLTGRRPSGADRRRTVAWPSPRTS